VSELTPEQRAEWIAGRLETEIMPLEDVVAGIAQAIRDAVAAEREAIAAMVESWPVSKDVSERILAAAIRARKETP
jgi:ferric-dicitrate binding protein FerR (iron transport regulator)